MPSRRPGSPAIPWTDIELERGAAVSHPDLVKIQERFGLHPVVMKELTSPSPRARVEDFGTYLFLAYQFPVYDASNFVSRRTEIDFIVSREEVVTVHYERIHALEFALNQTDILDGKHADSVSFEILYHVLSHLIAFNQRQLRHISEKVESIAGDLFTGDNRQLLERISYLKRDISEYRIVFSPVGQLLESLARAGGRFFGEDTVPYLNDLHADFLRTFQQLEDYRAAMIDYEVTNNQLMAARNGDVMKTLTMMSFITFPLVLVAALFAVRLEGIPFLAHPHGFWILLAGMVALSTAFLLYFKRKRWI